jgi:non-heme chloroperoxidase
MDTKAVVDAATEDGGPVLLVGHSMGAMAAVAWAGRYPGLVKEQVSAVLLASTGIVDLTTAGHLVPIPDSLRFLRGVANWIFLATPVPSGPPSPLSHLVVKYTSFAPTAPDDQVSFCEEIIVKCPPIVRSKWARMMGSLNLDKEAEALTVPTSVLYGTLDRLTPPDQALHLAEVLPNLDKLIEIPGVGHMTPIEATDELASEIRRLSNNYRQAEVPPSK